MNPLASNLLRTYVPILVGAVASWLAARGIHVDAQTQAAAVVAMTGIFQAAYYTVVRVLEERWPAVGGVLLLSKAPVSLHTAGACPGVQEDYGHDWPPREDQAPAGYEQRVYAQPSQPTQATTGHLGLAGAYDYQAPKVAETRPDPVAVRKANTGAIPVYKPPPGR